MRLCGSGGLMRFDLSKCPFFRRVFNKDLLDHVKSSVRRYTAESKSASTYTACSCIRARLSRDGDRIVLPAGCYNFACGSPSSEASSRRHLVFLLLSRVPFQLATVARCNFASSDHCLEECSLLYPHSCDGRLEARSFAERRNEQFSRGIDRSANGFIIIILRGTVIMASICKV